jgi:hypothetical protein
MDCKGQQQYQGENDAVKSSMHIGVSRSCADFVGVNVFAKARQRGGSGTPRRMAFADKSAPTRRAESGIKPT